MFFKCTITDCEKLFNCKKALKEHERTHNQDRPFKCDLCDQTFTQYSSLQKHARVHDKKKPYQCDFDGCNQAFSQVSNLIRHQRIHTGDKPYICEHCDKKFASGSNLKQHLQIHDKQDSRNQFVCMFQECGKNYLYQSSLKKHYLMSHKDEYETYLKNEAIETCGFHMRTENQDEAKQDGSINQLEDSSIGSGANQQAPAVRKATNIFKQEKQINVYKDLAMQPNQANNDYFEVSQRLQQAPITQNDMFKIQKQEMKGSDREKEIQKNRNIAKRLASSSLLQLDLQDSHIKRAKLGVSQQPLNQIQQQNLAASMSLQQNNLIQRSTDASSTTSNNNANNCFVNYYQYLIVQNQPQPQERLNNSEQIQNQQTQNSFNNYKRSIQQGFGSQQLDKPKDYLSNNGFGSLQQQHLQLQQQLAQCSNPSSPFIRGSIQNTAGSRHAQETYRNSLNQRVSQYLQPSAGLLPFSQSSKNLLGDQNETASDFLGNPLGPYINDSLQAQSPYPQSFNNHFNPLQQQYQQLQQQQYSMGSVNFEKYSNKSINGQSPSSLKKIPVIVLSQNGKDQIQAGVTGAQMQQQDINISNNPSTFQKINQLKMKEVKTEIQSPQVSIQLKSEAKNIEYEPILDENCEQISPFDDGVQQSLIYSNMNKDIEDISKGVNNSSSNRETPTFQKLTGGSAFTTVRQRESNNGSPRSACSVGSNSNNRFLTINNKDSKQSSFFKKQAGNNENYSFTQFYDDPDINEKNGGVSAMLKQHSFGVDKQEFRRSKNPRLEDPEIKAESNEVEKN